MNQPFEPNEGGEFQSPSLERLVRSLSRLPGLGRKSATRLALHLISEDAASEELVQTIVEAGEKVTNCSNCGAITEPDPCRICTSESRLKSELCIVASPIDVLPFEKAGFFRGKYFVLGQLLSPLDGVRADDLPFDQLAQRVREDQVKEIIIALDSSVEGETTALYVQQMFQGGSLQMTRLATGIPVGGALAYTDEITLQRAFTGRRTF